MSMRRRNHPLMMLHELGKLLRNSAVFFILLFVIHAGSEAWYIVYGRYALVVLFIVSLLAIPYKWYSRTYAVNETAIQLTRRRITTTKQTVPFSKVQHVNRKTYWFHRLFGVTSLILETSITGEESSIVLPVIKVDEAEKIEGRIEARKSPNELREEDSSATKVSPIEVNETNEHEGKVKSDSSKTVHFTPTKKDILKATFTSLSFLAIIPIAGSLISKVEDFHLENKMNGILSSIVGSTWTMSIVFIFLILISIGIGMVRTVVKYGKYEIASTDEKVIITKGIAEESNFSIEKDKVQAILIEQTLLKRMLGLASVTLVSAGGSLGESEVSTLYPFLPIKRAISIVEEMLPQYRLIGQMERLPRKAMYLRLLKPSWFWMITTGALFWLKPDPFNFTWAWWALSLVLLVLIVTSRVLDYLQTKYAMNKEFVQMQTGGFTLTTYLSKREKIIEMEASRTFLQKVFGLATLNVVNRANPIRHTTMRDAPSLWVKEAYGWYMDRKKEIHFQ